jgi:hypothetical protein
VRFFKTPKMEDLSFCCRGLQNKNIKNESSLDIEHLQDINTTLHSFYNFPKASLSSFPSPLYLKRNAPTLTSKHQVQPKDHLAPVPVVDAAAAAAAADYTPAVDTADAAEDQAEEAAAHNHAATYSAVVAVVDHTDDSVLGFGLVGEKSIGFVVRRLVESWACRRRLGCSCSFVGVVDVVVGKLVVAVGAVGVVGE